MCGDFTYSDPKDCVLCFRDVNSAETLMEDHKGSLCEMYENEHICSDPSDGELCFRRLKLAENLMMLILIYLIKGLSMSSVETRKMANCASEW